jgi:N utilization substance protein A
VREAERDTVYNEYIGRVGEIVNATVKRIEGPDVIFDLGKAEARMPRKEQSRLESFAIGERVRVVIARVERAAKGPGVVVSRAVPDLVQHLFQTEVPEIYDGTVVIRAIAREAGERTKIAVMSKDKDVDAVGACVGMKGMRVQSIIRELRGEKIDIIEYHEDAVTFAEKALQPAKVSRVTVLDGQDKHLEVVVDDSQLSLAIGKKGQNVRLASRLSGWNLEVRSESEAEDESRRARLSLSAIPGVGDVTAELLFQHGFKSAGEVAQAGEAALAEVDGIPEEKIPGVLAAARSHVEQLQREAAAAAAAAAAEAAARLEENTETFDDVEVATEPLAAEPREPEERS